MHLIFRFYHLYKYSEYRHCAALLSVRFFLQKYFRSGIRPYGLMSLGLTVWIIYTIDHLRDAKKISHQASTERHRFHQRNFRILICPLDGVAILVDVLTIFFIRKQILEWGLILYSVCHFIFDRTTVASIRKRSIYCLLYSCGVLLLSYGTYGNTMDPTTLLANHSVWNYSLDKFAYVFLV